MIVKVPGIGSVTFPDGMSEDDVSGAINDHFKQVGVEQSIRAATLPTDILNAPGVADASAGARAEHRRQRIADVAALQEERLPAAWTLQPETIEGLAQGVRPFLNPPKAAVQAGINAVAAGQRALGLPSYDTEGTIFPKGIAKQIVDQNLFEVPANWSGPVPETLRGVRGAAEDLVGGLKPADIAMLTPAGSMGYATEMAASTPESTAAAADALGRGDIQEAAKQSVNAGFGLVGSRGIFKHLASTLPTQPVTPDYNGTQIPRTRGAFMPAEPLPIERNTPSAAAMLENQMQREATGVDFNPRRRYQKAVVPEGSISEEPAKGIAEPEEKAVGLELQARVARAANARTKAEIQALFPNMNRQQAAEVRNVAWGPPQTLLEAEPLENAPGEIPTEGVNKALAEDKANAEGGAPGELGGAPASSLGLANIDEPTRLQSTPDSIDAALHFLGNRATAETAFREGFDALKADDQKAVISRVSSALDNDEIFRSIVQFVPVSVMNDLIGKNTSPKELLSNKAMLKDKLSTGVSEPSVGLPVSRFFNAMLSSPEILKAIKGAKLPIASDLRGFTPERNAAIITPEAHAEEATRIAAGKQQQPTPTGEQNAIEQRNKPGSIQPERIGNDESGTPTEAGGGGGLQPATEGAGNEAPSKTEVTPVTTIEQAVQANSANTHVANAAGMSVKTIADLDALKAKLVESQKQAADLMDAVKAETDPAKRLKLVQQAMGAQFVPQWYREAIETAANLMSNAESDVTKLGERPLDWQKNKAVADWIRTNSKELYPGPNYENLPAELKAAEKSSPIEKAAIKVEARVDKVAAIDGARPAKEIKSELVDRIQKSIDDAPSEFDALSKAIKAKGATVALNAEKFAEQARDVQKDIPKITIDIPGDGKFTIRNTKEALQTLLERAKTISTAPGAPVKVKRRGVSVEQGRQFAKEAEVKPTATADAMQDALDRQASEALKRIDERDKGTKFGSSPDPAHYLRNAADYAIYGAAKLAKLGIKGVTMSAEWVSEMRKAFGRRIDPFLDRIYDAAKAHLEQYRQQMGGNGKPTDAQSIINEATGARRQIDSTNAAIDALQTGLRTVRALREHFNNAPSVSKAEVKLADNWLEADANRIRDGLTDLVKRELPLEERGKFITAINNASKRAPILTGDPEAMYRRAAEVAARIEDRAQEVRKANTIQDLKTTVNRALSSPGVDIGYKNRILDLLKRVSFNKPTAETIASLKATREYIDRMAAEGKDVEMPREILDHLELLTKIPIRDLPADAVAALSQKIAQLEQLGRLKVKARAEAWEIEKRNRMADLPAEETTPLEKRPEFINQPGDTLPASVKLRNWINQKLNNLSKADKAYLPQDAVFDMIGDSKANYRGWLFRQIRGPLDLAFNEYAVLRDQITDPITTLVKKYKMGQAQAERINTYARAMQEGGIDRLVAQGVDPKTIDKIIETFTPEERHVYSEMRKAMDSLLPQIQKLMHELYNIEVKPVENYWPLPRDWESMRDMLKPEEAKEPVFGEPKTFDDLAGWKDMFADFVSPKTTRSERGMTIERKPKAMTPAQNNAFDVFYQHINDVAYLLKTQRDLKMAGEMARTDTFAGKYGKLGQALVLDFLDTYARQGRLGGLRRIPWLDELRSRTAVGIIGFRVASNLVHASNVAFAVERAGIQNYSAAMMEIASGRADEFMRRNFAEAFARGGGEPGLVEAAAKGQSVFGKTVVSKELAKASMAGARAIDRINAEATMLGVYFKELRRKGIDPATYKDMPIDKEAQAYAMVMARRAVASPLPKDVPSAISRGTLTGGNISIGKSVMQFQNIFADQWSNLRHDFWRAGIMQKDPVKAARMALAIMGVMALEMGIREGVKSGLSMVSGKKPKDDNMEGLMMREAARRFPLGGQATAAILYGSSGVPMIDAFWDPAKDLYRATQAKDDTKMNQHIIKSITGAGQLMGLPVGQLGEIVSDSMAK